jgi:hypothetical protein
MNRSLWLGLLLTAAGAGLTPLASAQTDANTIPASRPFESPERFIVELRGGPYGPDFKDNPAFENYYQGDVGPFLGLQLSYIALRLPELAYLTFGGGFGWADYSGKAREIATRERVSEDTNLTILPLSAIAALRVDAMARRLKVPFIFTGKVGFQWVHWNTSTGENDDASGWSVGFLWGAQLALDLDLFERAAARSMDEEWGINHSFLFFEFYDFIPTADSLELGDTSWLLGLGFNF